MAKLNYNRDVVPLINRINRELNNERPFKLSSTDELWSVERIINSSYAVDRFYTGTLRECYCYLLGFDRALNK